MTSVVPFPTTPRKQHVSADSETMIASPKSNLSTTGLGDMQIFRFEGSTALAPIPIDVLYPATENNRSDLIQALRLLQQAGAALEKARDALRSEDVIQSDHHVNSVQRILPDLFRCRTIGDGFAGIINALEIAFVNQGGKPLAEKQIVATLRTLKELRSRPFVPFEAAQQTIEELEKAGLRVDPATLGDFLDAES